ncbi:hypothetical protein TNCV_2913201 [Trichonephila clavipes]|nr:hypothetical protein TNCV_2913201 [Trichonephila clavipes]
MPALKYTASDMGPVSRAAPATNIETIVNTFVQTREISKSPSQMIPDMLNWRQIWGSGRPRKVVTVWRQSCDTLAV